MLKTLLGTARLRWSEAGKDELENLPNGPVPI